MALTSTALVWSLSPTHEIRSASLLFWSLYLISMGQGGYNPSLQAFGADQLDDEEELPCSKDDKKSKKKSSFFQWWYFGVCSGSLMGVTFMSYVQDNFGWVLGFAIPMLAMVTSVALFCAGSRTYMYKRDEAIYDKPFQGMVQALKATKAKFMGCATPLSSCKTDEAELE